MRKRDGRREDAPKQSALCECAVCAEVCEGVFRLDFAWDGPAPSAGQFFLLRPERTAVFLARPFSAAAWRREAGGLVLSFLAARKGRGTADIAALRPGERAELTGPLGNGWRGFADGLPGGPFALVSGGAGVAPLAAWAAELGDMPDRPFDFYAGFRSAPFGIDGVTPRSLVITAEDGSAGRRGRIPEFFSPAGYAAVFACGPVPLLAAVKRACAGAAVPCFVSMETRMACGVGACLGCVIHTKTGNKRCCADGPVFNAEDVSLDE
jgi:NAD(P)H-flavin reductase